MKPLFSTSDLFDTFGDSCQLCETQFRQYGLCTVFSGKIRTVKCSGDNVLLRRLLETKSESEALVVDGSGYLGSGLMGSTLAELALKNGWVGAVILGAVRDVNALHTLTFGIKSQKEREAWGRPGRRRVIRWCNFCPGPMDLQ
jgi:regulator of ribonuclease activity A